MSGSDIIERVTTSITFCSVYVPIRERIYQIRDNKADYVISCIRLEAH